MIWFESPSWDCSLIKFLLLSAICVMGFFACLFVSLAGLSCLQEGKQAHSEDISWLLPLMCQYWSLSVYIKKHLILLNRLIQAADKILTKPQPFGCLSTVVLTSVCNIWGVLPVVDSGCKLCRRGSWVVFCVKTGNDDNGYQQRTTNPANNASISFFTVPQTILRKEW